MHCTISKFTLFLVLVTNLQCARMGIQPQGNPESVQNNQGDQPPPVPENPIPNQPAPEANSENSEDATQQTLQLVEFKDPKSCRECHIDHVRQWEASSHAYAVADPVFKAMLELGQKQSKGKLGQFCIGCHSPSAKLFEEAPVTIDEHGTHVQPLVNLSKASLAGVTCEACHRIEKNNELHNAEISYLNSNTMLGGIKEPLPTDAHESKYSEFHKTSEVCASCHNVTNPKGVKLEETFDEWKASKFSQEPIKTCQSCHMPVSKGRATKDGPIREIHNHLMPGVDVSLLARGEFPGYDLLREATEKLLKSSANFKAEIEKDILKVSIENLSGHALPSGATAERQLWIEVKAQNLKTTAYFFETGTLDKNGDLRDGNPKHSIAEEDKSLVVFRQEMTDPSKINTEDPFAHIVMMPWQASGKENHLIAAGETYTHHFPIFGHQGFDKPYKVTVRLLFRSFPPYFLRFLVKNSSLDQEVIGRVPIVEIASEEILVLK